MATELLHDVQPIILDDEIDLEVEFHGQLMRLLNQIAPPLAQLALVILLVLLTHCVALANSCLLLVHFKMK